MTTIIINDNFDNDVYEINYLDCEECGLYTIFNVEEIKYEIANKFRDDDEIYVEDIKKVIDKYLSFLGFDIFLETYELLFNNGKCIKGDKYE